MPTDFMNNSRNIAVTRYIALTLVVCLMCPSLGAMDPPTAHHYFLKSSKEPVAKWSYAGATGPKNWAGLNPGYRLAAVGKQQSPIEIDTQRTVSADLPELKFDYRRERISAVNNGHAIQHNDTPGSFLYLGDEKYSLEQFHLHAPSEHTVDGKHFEMEVHFVHKSRTGAVAVVAVFVKGDAKADLEIPLYREVPAESGEEVDFDGTRNPSDYLPRNRKCYHYSGSFTTPPCTENIQWFVMEDPVAVKPQVIARFSTILKSNNRPVQMLNDRVVQKSR